MLSTSLLAVFSFAKVCVSSWGSMIVIIRLNVDGLGGKTKTDIPWEV